MDISIPKTNRTTDFDTFFAVATRLSGPYPYQRELATDVSLPELLSVPTGVGKTAAAILGWLWRRRFHGDAGIRDATPRRLVYCLPMRTLVEQTRDFANNWLNRLGMLTENTGNSPVNGWAKQQGDTGRRIAVSILMGGSEKDELRDWSLWPERDAILIGTQDMLLSRVLNRGYAAGRARWPLDFALLNNDCLWVFDEVQLMSTGLATSLQLDAWRKSLPLQDEDGFRKAAEGTVARSCHSLWMSATLAKHWLETAVDWKPRILTAWKRMEEDRANFRLRDCGTSGPLAPLFAGGNKPIKKEAVAKIKAIRGAKDGNRAEAEYLTDLTKAILNFLKQRSPAGVTLIIVNTVDRARGLFHLLDRANKSSPQPLAGVVLHLIHSRFRPAERETWKTVLDKDNLSPRVIISTQVVEAGVDLSASVLFTELAPWPSLVQRFGRCARYIKSETGCAESGKVYWMDTLAAPLPYDETELKSAQDALQQLDDAGLAGLERLLGKLDDDHIQPDEAQRLLNEERRKLFPYAPRFVPRDKDLFDLFDTTPDLTGADLDISRFIRDGDERDVQVFWRDITTDKKPRKKLKARREELCPVPFITFRKFVEKLPYQHRAWRWNYVIGDWERVIVMEDRSEVIFPGQVFLLDCECGGYDLNAGWSSESKARVEPVPIDDAQSAAETSMPKRDDESGDADTDEEHDEGERLSAISEKWQSIEQHTRDVCTRLDALLTQSQLGDSLTESESRVLRIAARWHDRGKAHDAFQAKLKVDELNSPVAKAELCNEPAAKAPSAAWRRDKLQALSTATRFVLPSEDSSAAEVDENSTSNSPTADKRRPKFRHELASALAILKTLWQADSKHLAFAWPDGLEAAGFSRDEPEPLPDAEREQASRLIDELTSLTPPEVDLLLYIVAAHHGKVRMSLRSVPEDLRTELTDACPPQARGVRDNDPLPKCRLPGTDNANAGWTAPPVTLHLDPMELGLSGRYGASWRERTQRLLERLGPFRLAYLESLLRIADCRASAEEDAAAKLATAKGPHQ
ncbi:MAG: hypothetical protein DWH80_07935 [Planctomycetota bacterium]|nr:MAG: hypothetical protein DWH80_07935 [Planctomycetota bacterium]